MFRVQGCAGLPASVCGTEFGGPVIEISVDPVALTLGPFTLHWYGIMVALAVASLVVWVWYFATRKGGVTTDQVMAAALFMIPLGIITARLVHVVDKYSYYADHPGEIFGFAGLTIFGAILGGFLGAWIYCRLRRLPFGLLVDLTAPGIILAQAIGRVGCMFNGCCGGTPTSLPWAFSWTHPDSAASACAPLGTLIHPTQLYELLGDLVIFALLFWVLRGRVRPNGSLLAIYLLLYSALTFTVRFWRGDVETFAGPIQEGQLIAMIVFVLAAGWLILKRAHWASRESDEGPPGGQEASAVVGAE